MTATQPGTSAPRVPLSVLDLVTVSRDVATAITASMDAVRLAERAGYARYWFAEHHNTRGVASSATAVLIAQAAALTRRIRVGAGGVMLPNHAPLMVAESYGTLAQLFPDRIDLGLGRAPGTDLRTAQALARSAADPQAFARNIFDLQGWFGPDGIAYSSGITSAPSAGTEVPLWVLGSSLDGASIAGQLGLPYAVASHFAPEQYEAAIRVYRDTFTTSAPTARLDKPHVMVAVNVMTCDDSREAHRQFTTVEQMFLRLRRGETGLVPPPVDDLEPLFSPAEIAMGKSLLRVKAVGNPAEVVAQLEELVARTGANELITATWTHDPAVRLRSLELTAQAWLD